MFFNDHEIAFALIEQRSADITGYVKFIYLWSNFTFTFKICIACKLLAVVLIIFSKAFLK